MAGYDEPSAAQRLAPGLDGDERGGAACAVVQADESPAEDLIAGELLVEEISIDGMCGVY